MHEYKYIQISICYKAKFISIAKKPIQFYLKPHVLHCLNVDIRVYLGVENSLSRSSVSYCIHVPLALKEKIKIHTQGRDHVNVIYHTELYATAR